MNDRNKVVELLTNYRSYRFAVNNCESEPESLSFGIRLQPFVNSNRMVSISEWDMIRYTRILRTLEAATEDVLSDDEREVIRFKYLERNTLTLKIIADRLKMHENTAKHVHKRALKKLSNALMFVEMPEIINVDQILTPA